MAIECDALDPEPDADFHFELGGLNGAYALVLVVFKVVGDRGFNIDTHQIRPFVLNTQASVQRPLKSAYRAELAGGHVVKPAHIFIGYRPVNGSSSHSVNSKGLGVDDPQIDTYGDANVVCILVYDVRLICRMHLILAT